jgi:ethanolamine utilization microcompartment shell protein EutS
MNAAGFASGSFATTGSNTFTGNQNYANNSVIGDTTYSTLGGNPINLYYGISKGDIANRFGGIKISNYDWSGGNLASKFEIYTDSEAQDFSTRRFLVDGFGNININANTEITGNLVVTGKLTAQEFHTEIVSASIIYESGSTKFGDTLDDTHQFTGSLLITGSLVVPESSLPPSAIVGTLAVSGNQLWIYM